MSPNQFTVIPWGSSTYFVAVAIDPSGGDTFGNDITNQQLVSVPYVLYAEKSVSTGLGGNLTASPNVTVTSPGTNSFNINVPNYVAGPNVTITPLTANNYEIASAAGSGATGSLTASPNVTVTTPGTNTFNISVPNYIMYMN